MWQAVFAVFLFGGVFWVITLGIRLRERRRDRRAVEQMLLSVQDLPLAQALRVLERAGVCLEVGVLSRLAGMNPFLLGMAFAVILFDIAQTGKYSQCMREALELLAQEIRISCSDEKWREPFFRGLDSRHPEFSFGGALECAIKKGDSESSVLSAVNEGLKVLGKDEFWEADWESLREL